MENETTQTTLRDTISSAFDTVTAEATQTQTPQTTVDTQTQSTQAQTDAERARDAAGRFAKAAEHQQSSQTQVTARPQRPSSWKKDYWEHWDKLDPKLAEYLSQREQEFAKGVSTYKQEWDQAKPLVDAVAPFMPILQQHNIKPNEWISNLGHAHQALVMGSPEQKLSMFLKLAQDYQVPLESLFAQGQDGRVYFNPQVQPYQAPQAPQQDMRRVVQELLFEQQATQEIQQFSKRGDFPYFEQVRETMAGLLQQGLVDDLESAYHAALRMPRHSDLYEQAQAKQREADEQRKRDEAAKAAANARAKAVSVKSSTPTGPVTSADGKGLRSTIEKAFDEYSARV